MNEPLKLDEGCSIEVYGDLEGEGADASTVAIVHLTSVLEFLGDSIEIPGASFQPPHGTEVTVRANVRLNAEQGRLVIAAIEEAIRPLTDDERAAEVARFERQAREPEAASPLKEKASSDA